MSGSGGRPADRRRHPRERRRLMVRFGVGDLAHVGHTQDVSEGGLYLKAQIVFPPGTVMVLHLETAEGVEVRKGIVRWSKEPPPAFRRSMPCGMGVELLADASRTSAPSAPRPPGPPAERSASSRQGTPPEKSDSELGGGATHRRQVSTLSGNTYEILLTEYRGAWYVRAYQLPRTDGSAEAVFRVAFWTREEADRAVRGFLKEH